MPPHDRVWTLIILGQVLLAAIAAAAGTLIFDAWLR
jgi:hypothetical protein